MSHSQQVGPRICKFELSGESNIYVCPRDEYCCNVGCCISPTFQFYQLWYYWFMVFFMFLVCSGGQWWYRYVMQGRCASAMPAPARRASYPRQARVAYTPARDTVVLHHLWKPSYPGGPPPSYSQIGASSSSGCSGAGPKPSPYMQLYGPPPSYDSVVGAGPASIHRCVTPGYDEAEGGEPSLPMQTPPYQAHDHLRLPAAPRAGGLLIQQPLIQESLPIRAPSYQPVERLRSRAQSTQLSLQQLAVCQDHDHQPDENPPLSQPHIAAELGHSQQQRPDPPGLHVVVSFSPADIPPPLPQQSHLNSSHPNPSPNP